MLVSEAYFGWIAHLERYAEKTRKTYKWVLQNFMAVSPAKVREVTVEHIERFVLAPNYLNTSRNTRLFALRNFYQWLEATYGIENIAKKVRHLKPQPPHNRMLTKEEYHKVIEATTGKARITLQVLAMTGLREAEFLALTPQHIKGDKIILNGKGNRRKVIPINPTLKQILISNPDFDFSKNSVSGVWRICKRAAITAAIPHFSPHSLRHYSITAMITGNGDKTKAVPIEIVSKIVGTNPDTLRKTYIHLFDKDVENATDCL